VPQGSISYYKIQLLHNLFKGEQKDTATTTASAQAPSIQQKQVDKIATKCKDSFYTQASHVAKLVEQSQPFQQHVRDNLQQAKQRNFSSKASNSPRFKFNKCFFPSPSSTQRNGDHCFLRRED
jgi:hypothetical protein